VDVPRLRPPQRRPRAQLPRHPMEHACAPAHHNPPGERVYPSRAHTQRPVLTLPLQSRTLRDADCIHIVAAKHCE